MNPTCGDVFPWWTATFDRKTLLCSTEYNSSSDKAKTVIADLPHPSPSQKCSEFSSSLYHNANEEGVAISLT